MSRECLKLTTYFGERKRGPSGFLADDMLELYERHAVQVSVLLRGTEGFGGHHRLQTQRVLSLSEDLPLVAVAVDARERIEALLGEVRALGDHGLVTLERARFDVPAQLDEEAKLTVYAGRKARVGGRPAHEGVVALLHRHGVAGATVLLGVDGTAHGVRERARFLGANADVPLMIVSVGDAAAIAGAAAELGRELERPLMTYERIRVCKRDGARLAEPLAGHNKLMVYAGEQARHGGAPLYTALVRRLREAGLAGATALRGIHGYHGDHAPHGERFWSLRRHVPVVTVVVDTPERIARAYGIVDELTDETGLVTSELAAPVGSSP